MKYILIIFMMVYFCTGIFVNSKDVHHNINYIKKISEGTGIFINLKGVRYNINYVKKISEGVDITYESKQVEKETFFGNKYNVTIHNYNNIVSKNRYYIVEIANTKSCCDDHSEHGRIIYFFDNYIIKICENKDSEDFQKIIQLINLVR